MKVYYVINSDVMLLLASCIDVVIREFDVVKETEKFYIIEIDGITKRREKNVFYKSIEEARKRVKMNLSRLIDMGEKAKQKMKEWGLE